MSREKNRETSLRNENSEINVDSPNLLKSLAGLHFFFDYFSFTAAKGNNSSNALAKQKAAHPWFFMVVIILDMLLRGAVLALILTIVAMALFKIIS